ncbi:hypothetical protein ACKFKG_26845 [Phormidesmis sp. 146-35]
MRLYITKKHHQQLLTDLAAQLGSDSPTDALEHILNCWTVLPPSSTPHTSQSAPPEGKTDDPLAGLGQF